MPGSCTFSVCKLIKIYLLIINILYFILYYLMISRPKNAKQMVILVLFTYLLKNNIILRHKTLIPF
jgi:hypothetical protein